MTTRLILGSNDHKVAVYQIRDKQLFQEFWDMHTGNTDIEIRIHSPWIGLVIVAIPKFADKDEDEKFFREHWAESSIRKELEKAALCVTQDFSNLIGTLSKYVTFLN